MTGYRPRAGKRPSARQEAPGPAIPSGVDREGTPPRECFQELQNELAHAGAVIDLDTLIAWTAEQVEEARAWARQQILANLTADSRRHVSVRWPDHVSAAHLDGMKPYAVIDMPPPEPNEVMALMKRPRRKAQTPRVKQAADRKTRRRRG